MATILIAAGMTPGHINPALKFARALQSQGHRIHFCGFLDARERIVAEGFDFEPLFPDLFPEGDLEEVTSLRVRRDRWGQLRHIRRHVGRVRRMMEAILAGALDGLFQRLKPDLFICDVIERALHLVAYGNGVPTVLVNTTVPMAPQPRPPKPSWRAPMDRVWGAFRASLRRTLEKTGARLGFIRPMTWFFSELARKYGHIVEGDGPGRFFPSATPMVVLCPGEFIDTGDAPRRESLHFLGPCIALDREEPDFDWSRIQEGRPLILIALGSVPYLLKRHQDFIRGLGDAAARRPDWQFVVSAGPLTDLGMLERAAPNIIAAHQVPQLGLLQRATAMVTHCGFNSTKEAIYFGVPMVALPFQHDQPRVARLVTHHGLGVRGSPFDMTGETLVALLDEVITQPGYRQASQAMSMRFREAESPQAMARTLEQFLEKEQEPLPRPSGT
ncbi:glycosyl transferase [Myxococcus stipitatus DSM 14675]|uniref:Glycosyl transferase n=1 Tax=Myxococcus stipitatus (strain DSM 14675 / JCM 12634 / Mx s8) TaxID=1278073 RepID=L7U9N1_MYXSD|nr:glycosyltransferase [Myxococcus stipitatus]AGC45646.1 glycosyl transferase [Myxococcus stipitatus DSM 14675]